MVIIDNSLVVDNITFNVFTRDFSVGTGNIEFYSVIENKANNYNAIITESNKGMTNISIDLTTNELEEFDEETYIIKIFDVNDKLIFTGHLKYIDLTNSNKQNWSPVNTSNVIKF